MEGGQCVRDRKKVTCNRLFLGHRSSHKGPRPHTTRPKKHLISDRIILATLLVPSVGTIVSHGREYPFPDSSHCRVETLL